MCGRYTLAKPIKTIQSHFGPMNIKFEYFPSYNIAPSQISPIVINHTGQRELTTMKWGLMPSWANDEKINFINARSETAHEKPSFKSSLKNQRCLVPADGFLEWAGKEKLPHYIQLRKQALFAFAGLWSKWNNPEGTSLHTYTILTTEANEKLTPIHARMPVILPLDQYNIWLDPDSNLEAVRPLLTSYPSEEFDFHPVSKEVNSPKNNHPKILQRL
jgi:putative SOS response-associated peptidase YedK